MLCSILLACLLPSVQSFMRAVHRSSLTRVMAGEPDQQFAKYQGLGNDFILINNLQSTTPVYSPEQAVRLCDRNFGIGADGVIFVLPGKDGCDYTMRIYNSDGSEPQMCGYMDSTSCIHIYNENIGMEFGVWPSS